MKVLASRTDYSFMRGYGSPQQWLERCKEIGVTDFAVTDLYGTWGHEPFAKAFKDSGVNLHFGVQLPVVQYLTKDPRHSLVTIIAQKDVADLYKLVKLATEQTYYRPRITWAQLEEVAGSCVVFVSYSSPLDKRIASAYPTLPYTATFPSPEHRAAWELMQGIAGFQTAGEIAVEPLHMLRAGELAKKFPDSLYSIKDGPADRLKTIKLNKAQLMKLEGDVETLAREGARELGIDLSDPVYWERFQRELTVIREKNFEDYFLFVRGIVNFAKQRMFVGPGRGSSGGSLLCYLLGITTVDPVKFGTRFERFIDITRPDLPDIDVDFPDVRRDLVFDYLRDTYGSDNVARLGTITEFGGKSALNDTAKAEGIPRDVATTIGKFTEGGVQGLVLSPAWVFSNVAEVEPLLEKHPNIRKAALIDGHPRHHGVHAAGVVVTDKPITTYGSVTKDAVLQMDMKSAENLGLIKMDALGLRTLSVLQECCDLIGMDPKELYKLDWEDQDVYERIFNTDRVTGVFQFEGPAVRALAKGSALSTFDDLCAVTSLARPGPLIGGAASAWVASKLGNRDARTLHPDLDRTFGLIVYQEQAMAIVRDLAGFDEPSVNGFRRAVGKKDPDKLRTYRQMFMDGASTKLGEDQAEDLWDEMCEFGSYAFNYSHAVAYCMISFMCAWLKLKHPLEFALAQMRNTNDDEQAKALLRELIEEGVGYCPFDPMKSGVSWEVVDGKLYGGYTGIKGIGWKTASNLVATRQVLGDKFLDAITEAQRKRILAPFNTPWHDLIYFSTRYKALYDDPNNFKRPYAPHGFKGPVYKIKDIPDRKGTFAFLCKITRKETKDVNEPERVEKRNGQVLENDTKFANLYMEDDTGSIGGTINRFKYEDFKWLVDGVTEGRDYFVRANIIENGRKWVFIDKIMELKEDG